MVALLVFGAPHATGQSLLFDDNAASQHEYGQQLTIPSGFGEAEFTLELWIRLDDSFPVGRTGCCAQQLVNWSDADNAPYSGCCWWYEGNFLLDGHNNSSFDQGTFSLQFYGGGRLRWLFGDGVFAGPGGHWSVGAFPATSTPSLLDGAWHQVTCVRRFVGTSSADLELWIDGVLIDTETTPVRANMRTWWDSWGGPVPFPAGQEGWFWGAEKQAAIGVLSQYEDYKGLVDEVRFWSRAKSAGEIGSDWALPVEGTEPGLVGWLRFDEGLGSSTCDTLVPARCIDLFLFDAGNWSASDAPGAPTSFPRFCDASDASLLACPCGNAGSPDAGCDLPQLTGGVRLEVVSQTRVPNRATLAGSGFFAAGAPTAIVIRSNALDAAAPVAFGDGLRCVGAAPLVRLAATTASGGSSVHEFGHGTSAGPGLFYYQVWFRSTPISFCDPTAAFNLSNGRILGW